MENVTIGVGSDELLDCVFRAVIDKGDKVVSFSPSFSMYKVFTELVGGEFIGVYGDDFKKIFKTITVDNGVEFANYEGMVYSLHLDLKGQQQKRTEIYYCHPYASWERGSNENT